MLKKRMFFLCLLLGIILVTAACSNNDEASTTEEENEKEESSGLVVSGDTVSEQGGCVLASRFSVGDKIVFRMDAVDPSTNKQVEDAKLQVHLSTGDVLDMALGEHPPDVENAAKFWTAAYTVTDETPTGTLDYYVTAEAGDKKAEFRPFNVAPSLLTIVSEEAAGGEPQTEEATAEPEKTTDIETNQNVDIIATNFKFNEKDYYVKAGEEVTVSLTSEEGTHGVAIDGLDVSIDEPNGSAKFTPTEPGEYQIYCSVFCGAGHSDMTATLHVVE